MMKPHSLVALGVLLGVTASAATNVLTQQSAPRSTPYLARCVPAYEMETQLNQFGARGWRLVSMAGSSCLVTTSVGRHQSVSGFFVVLGR
jgi:hypothetical protein